MDGPLRQVTFRVEHDCTLARLSRELPGVQMRIWSGHRFEVVAFSAPPRLWPETQVLALRYLKPVRVLRTAEGGMAVWHPEVDANASISRRLEEHDMMWLQPLRVQGGWEHYDAIGFGTGEQAAIDDLRRTHSTQVVRRRDIEPEDVAAALFMSVHPLLAAPTDKQAEALLAAGEAGYYKTPRRATTADVAKRIGIGRSAFEERLRGAENRVMAELLPALAWHRG